MMDHELHRTPEQDLVVLDLGGQELWVASAATLKYLGVYLLDGGEAVVLEMAAHDFRVGGGLFGEVRAATVEECGSEGLECPGLEALTIRVS